MGISKKPEKQTTLSETPTLSEAQIKQFIQGGGSVPAQNDKTEPDVKGVNLRFTPEALSRIDAVRFRRAVKTSRHSWLMEAIMDKLIKEETV